MFVSPRPQWDCLLEVWEEIVKENAKTSKELKESRAGIIQKLILSAALAQKGRVPLGLLSTCISNIPIWYCAGLKKLQHSQQLIGAGWNKTASSSSETLTATLELRAAPETCCKCSSSTPGSEMLLLPQPAVGHSTGRHEEWEPWINPEHLLYPKRLHKLHQLFQICLSPFLPPAHFSE